MSCRQFAVETQIVGCLKFYVIMRESICKICEACLCSIIGAGFLFAVFACGDRSGLMRKDDEAGKIAEICSESRVLVERRHFEEIIARAIPMLEQRLPSECEKYLYLQVCQAYIFLDSLQKGKEYVSRIDADDFPDPRLRGTYYNVMGLLALRTSMDYSLALNYFRQTLACAEESGDIMNICSAYSNIAALYNDRKDTAGLFYAMQAYELAQKIDNPVIVGFTSLQVGILSMLAGRNEEALKFAEKAEIVIVQYDLKNYIDNANILLGKINFSMGNYEEAERYLENVIFNPDSHEPAISIEAYFEYGLLKHAVNDYSAAEQWLLEAASLSKSTGNIEALPDILKGLAALYREAGDKTEAIKYYVELQSLTDSLSLEQKERDFNNLLINYEKAEYASSMQEKELALQKNRTRVAIMLLLLVLAVSIIVYVVSAYIKRNNVYVQLAEQHYRLTQRLRTVEKALNDVSSSAASSPALAKDAELWQMIEKIFSGENPAYRQKDMSIEKLAEMLDTNRTYISRVINRYAGVTFPAYLNLKRLQEATQKLRNPDDNISIKALADELGYNSMSAFIRVFSKEIGCPPAKYRKLTITNTSSS